MGKLERGTLYRYNELRKYLKSNQHLLTKEMYGRVFNEGLNTFSYEELKQLLMYTQENMDALRGKSNTDYPKTATAPLEPIGEVMQRLSTAGDRTPYYKANKWTTVERTATNAKKNRK